VFSLLFHEDDLASRVVVLARAYIDDSADGTRQKYVIATAVIGNLGQWRRLDRKWKAVLRADPGIAYFHSKEWRSLTGEFKQFTDKAKWPKPLGGEAANAKRDALLECLEHSTMIAIAIAILIPEYNQIRATDPRAKIHFSEDPYQCALSQLFFESAKAIEGIGGNHCIGFVSDDSNRASIYTQLYTSYKAKNPRSAQIMRGIAHLDDKKWPGLQAADLCAHIAKTTFDKWDGKDLAVPIKELKPCFYRVAYWNTRYMLGILAAQSPRIA
jgi:hypothetical protein